MMNRDRKLQVPLAVDEMPLQSQVGRDWHSSYTGLSTLNLPSVLFLHPHNHPAPSGDDPHSLGKGTEVQSGEGLSKVTLEEPGRGEIRRQGLLAQPQVLIPVPPCF